MNFVTSLSMVNKWTYCCCTTIIILYLRSHTTLFTLSYKNKHLCEKFVLNVTTSDELLSFSINRYHPSALLLFENQSPLNIRSTHCRCQFNTKSTFPCALSMVSLKCQWLSLHSFILLLSTKYCQSVLTKISSNDVICYMSLSRGPTLYEYVFIFK